MVELTAEQKSRIAADFKRRLGSCVPWTRNIKWQKEMNIVGASYTPLKLFPEIPPTLAEPAELREGEYIDSPGGSFRYAVRLHQRGRRLLTWWGPDLGDVIFDQDIEIPILFERKQEEVGGWNKFPWMSLTPGEILTLRVGTKLAKGKVVIGGLGLAHQLMEVGKRRAVTEIVVVERSHELCDLILPRALPLIEKKVTVLIGDAFKVIPTLEADVALIDVYPNYGCNHEATRTLAKKCKKIKKVWGWGTSELPRRG
jgi:hypothetical protein